MTKIVLVIGLVVLCWLPLASAQENTRGAADPKPAARRASAPVPAPAATDSSSGVALPTALVMTLFGVVVGAGVVFFALSRVAQSKSQEETVPKRDSVRETLDLLQTILSNIGQLSRTTEAVWQEQSRSSRDLQNDLQAVQQGLKDVSKDLREAGGYFQNGLASVKSQVSEAETGVIKSFDNRLDQLRREEGGRLEKLGRDFSEAHKLTLGSLQRWHEETAGQTSEVASDIRTKFERLYEWKITLPPSSGDADEEAGWVTRVESELRGLAEETRGNARLLASQQAQTLGALQQIDQDSRSWEREILMEPQVVKKLDKTIFRPSMPVAWLDIGENEASPRQWESLCILGTALVNYRRLLQQRFEKQFGFRVIPIILNHTHFDPVQHESSEYYSLRTSENDKDDLILDVIENGYQLGSQVLTKAVVRRYVHSPEASIEAETPTAGTLDEGLTIPQAAESGAPASEAPPEVMQIDADGTAGTPQDADATRTNPAERDFTEAEVRQEMSDRALQNSDGAEESVLPEPDTAPTPSPDDEKELMRRAMSQG